MRYEPVPDAVIDGLQQLLGDNFVGHEVVNGQSRVTVLRESISRTLMFLKQFPGCPFEMLSDVGGADLRGLPTYSEDDGDDRFVVWYTLTSVSKGPRIVIRCTVPEDDCRIESVFSVYKSCLWCERECWEMFGIVFEGHPDLRRLLTPDYFSDDEQYPLRKDYPLRGVGDRYNFPVYDPAEELDLTDYGYAGDEHGNPPGVGTPGMSSLHKGTE